MARGLPDPDITPTLNPLMGFCRWARTAGGCWTNRSIPGWRTPCLQGSDTGRVGGSLLSWTDLL